MDELALITAYSQFIQDTTFSRFWLIVHSDERINEQCYNEFILKDYACMKYTPSAWWMAMGETHQQRVLAYIKRKYIEHDPHVDDSIVINERIMHQAYGALHGSPESSDEEDNDPKRGRFSDVSLT